MGKNQFVWQERFNIGVESIDREHRKLFAIMNKLSAYDDNDEKSRWAYQEGIKYFKAYALKHFAEEEAYMRQIGYAGYLAHKQIHDRMRRETLPALEHLLYESDFSAEAVRRFIGVCTGWLTGHIIIEDRAITGQPSGNAPPVDPDSELSVIQAVIVHPLQEIFGGDIRFVGSYSPQDSIIDAQYYQLTYSTQEGRDLRVLLVMGEHLMLQAAGLEFGIDFYERNEIVCFAIQEIAQNLIQRAAVSFGQAPNSFQLAQERFLGAEEFHRLFQEHPPQYSLLFHVNQECFAICIDQIPHTEVP